MLQVLTFTADSGFRRNRKRQCINWGGEAAEKLPATSPSWFLLSCVVFKFQRACRRQNPPSLSTGHRNSRPRCALGVTTLESLGAYCAPRYSQETYCITGSDRCQPPSAGVSKLFRNVPCFDSLEMSSFPVYCTRARAEDRESLESDLSADAGGYTDGAGPWLCLFFLVSIWQSTMR